MLVCLLPGMAQAEVSFLRDVAPILTTRCTGCHGDKKSEGDYRLHTFAYLMLDGASGLPAVKPGKPEESELLARLTDSDPATRMPQEDDPLTADEIDRVRRWIAAGAKFDGSDPTASTKSQLPARTHTTPPERYPHPVPVYALAWSPTAAELAVAGHREVTVWSATGQLLRRIPGLPLRIHALRYNRAGTKLLVGGGSPGDYGELSLVDPTGKTAPRWWPCSTTSCSEWHGAPTIGALRPLRRIARCAYSQRLTHGYNGSRGCIPILPRP